MLLYNRKGLKKYNIIFYKTGGGTDMAKRCAVCGKEPVAGNSVAHSKKTTRRWWKPNVHKVKAVMDDGSVKRINVCTSCLKAGKVKRA